MKYVRKAISLLQISTPSAIAATTTMLRLGCITYSQDIMNLNMKEIGKRISDRRKKLRKKAIV